jgi:hypothetical protein
MAMIIAPRGGMGKAPSLASISSCACAPNRQSGRTEPLSSAADPSAAQRIDYLMISGDKFAGGHGWSCPKNPCNAQDSPD